MYVLLSVTFSSESRLVSPPAGSKNRVQGSSDARHAKGRVTVDGERILKSARTGTTDDTLHGTLKVKEPMVQAAGYGGSSFNAFEKLLGVKNYPDWRGNMETMFLTLRQWGMVDGTIVRPVPADPENITSQETAAITEFDLRTVSAYQEIKLRISANANGVLGRSRDPKTVWDILERRFGSRQHDTPSI